MRVVVVLGAVLLSLATNAQAGAGAPLPRHYVFSFTVALKPYSAVQFPVGKVTGSGSGSFTLGQRRVDRDGSVYWTLADARGTVSLAVGAHVFVTGEVTGGAFGTETATGGLTRSASLDLRITSSTRFHCTARNMSIGLEDVPLVAGNTQGLTFGACTPKACGYPCGPQASWNGRPTALAVTVKPT
jgi:hypothetical protein